MGLNVVCSGRWPLCLPPLTTRRNAVSWVHHSLPPSPDKVFSFSLLQYWRVVPTRRGHRQIGSCSLDASHPIFPLTAFPMIQPASWDWLDTTLNTKLHIAREVYSSQEMSPAVKIQVTVSEKSHQTVHQSRKILFKFTRPQNKHFNIGNRFSGTD